MCLVFPNVVVDVHVDVSIAGCGDSIRSPEVQRNIPEDLYNITESSNQSLKTTNEKLRRHVHERSTYALV